MLNEVVNNAARAVPPVKIDDKVSAVITAMLGFGIDARSAELQDTHGRPIRLVEFIARNDLAESARIIFEVLETDPYALTEGGAPLIRIAGPSVRQIIASCRMVSSVREAVGEVSAQTSTGREPIMGAL
jgi:hypothetical protein